MDQHLDQFGGGGMWLLLGCPSELKARNDPGVGWLVDVSPVVKNSSSTNLFGNLHDLIGEQRDEKIKAKSLHAILGCFFTFDMTSRKNNQF